MIRHALVASLLAGCPARDLSVLAEASDLPPEVRAGLDSPAPQPAARAWARTVEAHADAVVGLAIASDGATLVLIAERDAADDLDRLVLECYEPDGELRFTRSVSHRPSTIRGRLLAVDDVDTISVLEVTAPGRGPSTTTIRRFALADGEVRKPIVGPYPGHDANGPTAWVMGSISPSAILAVERGYYILAGREEFDEGERSPFFSPPRRTRPVVVTMQPDGDIDWIQQVRNHAVSDWDAEIVLAGFADGSIGLAGRCYPRHRYDSRVVGEDECDNASAFVSKWSWNGGRLWIQWFNPGSAAADGDVHIGGLAVRNQELVVSGTFSGRLVLGDDGTRSGWLSVGDDRDLFTKGGDTDGFVARIDADGQPLELWHAGGHRRDGFGDVGVDASGDAWVAGAVHGESALMLRRVDGSASAKHDGDATRPYGVIARIDFARGLAAVLPLQSIGDDTSEAHSAGLDPRAVAITGELVRVAGRYSARVRLPLLDGTHVHLWPRDENDGGAEAFLWAGWARLPGSAEP